ncbi:MAG TPA: SagB/ThcOx family dehydrogenase [Trebonia sp.]|nr:SagB/ThcOx family dehydrogenase [Trebonia sp.]
METATQVLHRLTSYEPGREWDEAPDDPRIRQDFEPNDDGILPLFYKRYDAGLPRVPLPRDLPVTAGPALAVLAGTAPGATGAGLDLGGLARLLYLSAGVVRTSPRRYGPHLFRAAGSAGGRFPMEAYVAIPDGSPGLPAGVHWYHPQDHALVTIGPAPGGDAPALVVTGVPWRTGWRYRERGFRHVYWDSGTMLSQVLALGDSAGLAPRLYSRFPDGRVAALTGADQVHEWPVALVALGPGTPAIEPAGPAASGAVDASPLEFPLVTAAQRGGDDDALGEPWDAGAPVDIPGRVLARHGATVDAVISRRGSQRRMDPGRGLARDTLDSCLSVALRGIGVAHWIAVHDVTGPPAGEAGPAGLAPGIYHWRDGAARLVREGTAAGTRAELYRVSLEQALARDAAFVVISATGIAKLSDREYREAQLAAGIVEGRLHLAAYALGAGATGMTFRDSDIAALLRADDPAPGEPLDEYPDGLLFTCVGVPGNTAKAAGPPGAPTEVRRVPERG